MKPAVLLALVVSCSLVAAACGDGDLTDCAIARERLDQCASTVYSAPAVATYQRLPLTIGDDCSGMNGCAAHCVKDKSCEALRRALLGHTTDPNDNPGAAVLLETGKFDFCINACIERYLKQ